MSSDAASVKQTASAISERKVDAARPIEFALWMSKSRATGHWHKIYVQRNDNLDTLYKIDSWLYARWREFEAYLDLTVRVGVLAVRESLAAAEKQAARDHDANKNAAVIPAESATVYECGVALGTLKLPEPLPLTTRRDECERFFEAHLYTDHIKMLFS